MNIFCCEFPHNYLRSCMQAHQLPAMSTEWKKFDPTSVEELWDEMKGSRVQYEITPDRQGAVNAPPSTPYLTIVMISDTHCELKKMIELNMIPDGDVLVHAGDITSYGDAANLAKFNEELERLPHRHKIVIAGNHELGFDKDEDQSKMLEEHHGLGTPEGWKLLTNCTFLNGSTTVVSLWTLLLDSLPFFAKASLCALLKNCKF
ncbi:hypothetical protein PRIPAC_82882 [Pristionchus pacificus]|uniref:Calcineurin-like phosphoesterase n=1 Tax=Pristionchus pacificus TaxID=54126 RepID=A0A2A6CPG4_PRIPA|nr:hypothetical protein PRIPAC_82882 [Pristionchus pacificus]|eukprot:PDM79957.1 Calcineurin-like phosphoesterase [Pristionchus pacificus]